MHIATRVNNDISHSAQWRGNKFPVETGVTNKSVKATRGGRKRNRQKRHYLPLRPARSKEGCTCCRWLLANSSDLRLHRRAYVGELFFRAIGIYPCYLIDEYPILGTPLTGESGVCYRYRPSTSRVSLYHPTIPFAFLMSRETARFDILLMRRILSCLLATGRR